MQLTLNTMHHEPLSLPLSLSSLSPPLLTFGEVLELIAGLLFPPLPGLEELPERRQLAPLLPRPRCILGRAGVAHHHITVGGRQRRLLQAVR